MYLDVNEISNNVKLGLQSSLNVRYGLGSYYSIVVAKFRLVSVYCGKLSVSFGKQDFAKFREKADFFFILKFPNFAKFKVKIAKVTKIAKNDRNFAKSSASEIKLREAFDRNLPKFFVKFWCKPLIAIFTLLSKVRLR